MARSHMRWQFGAWDKPDHARTSKDARHLYMVICSDETINQAGVLTMRPDLWAEEAAMTDDEVQAALDELEQRRFVVIDKRRKQLLVRTFIRNDLVYKQPNVLRSALSYVSTMRSAVIREALAPELRKLPEKPADKTLPSGKVFVYPDPHAAADSIDAALRSETSDAKASAKSCPNPSSKGSPNPSVKASPSAATRRRHAENAEPFGEPSVEGVGVGGSLKSVSTQVEGSRARAREGAPTPIGGRRNNAACRTHPDDGRPCGRCGDIRRAGHPVGYDPRPAADIPADEIDVEAWADPAEDLVPPLDVQLDDDHRVRERWHAQAQAEQRAKRAEQARQRLARYQARGA